MFEPQDIRASLPKYGREFAYTVLSVFTFVRSSSLYLFVLEEFFKKEFQVKIKPHCLSNIFLHVGILIKIS